MPADATDQYTTLAATSQAEPPKTKGSRFLGDALPVVSEEEAQAALDAVRRREHAATHHAWAWRLGAGPRATVRYSDDGEPSGSAGLPILRALEGRDLTDALVVVTRYYGGTKLGTGGLARAYGGAAEAALDAAPVRVVTIRVPLRLRFDFADTSPAMRTVERFDAAIAATDYDADGTALLVRVRRCEAEALEAAFVEALGGRGTVERGEGGAA